jgi:hypothetical protein
MNVTTSITEVRTFETRGGNTRYVARDADGREYTTFRQAIGERAQQLTGQRVEVEFHEEQRGQYKNVYLDRIEPAGPDSGEHDQTTEPDEAAWRTAVDAAPWLVGESEPHSATPPEELYEKLKPFKDKVAEDIKESEEDEG